MKKLKIQSILTEVNNCDAATLLEGWDTLSFKQKDEISRVEKELKPIFKELSETLLLEKELTKDEILSIFDTAVTKAEEEGNKTLLGKVGAVAAAPITLPIKVLKALDKKINELGKTIQNSEPVVNFDAKFDKLKSDILEKNGDKKVVKMLQYLSDTAKAHPKATSFVIGLTTAAVAILTGPLGAAAAGFIMNSVAKLLQGEKLSTALGTSVKTAIYGYLAGKAFQWLSKEVMENIAFAKYEEIEQMKQVMKAANGEAIADEALKLNPELASYLDAGNLKRVAMSGNINSFNYSYDVILNSENLKTFKVLQSAVNATEGFSPEYYEAASNLHDFMLGVQNAPSQSTWRSAYDVTKQMAAAGKTLSGDQINGLIIAGDNVAVVLNKLGAASKYIGAIIQGAIQQATIAKKNAVKVGTAEKVEEENPEAAEAAKAILPKVESIQATGQLLEEGIFSAAVEKVKTTGGNIMNVITKDKLMKAWQKAGSPTDSREIKKILSVYFTADIATEILLPLDPEITAETEVEKKIKADKELDKLADEVSTNMASADIIKYIKTKIAKLSA